MNRIAFKWSYLAVSTFVALVFIFSSCKKTDNNNPTPVPDISGFWFADQTITDTCSGSIETTQKTEVFAIEQHENQLLVTLYPNGDVVNGFINSNRITWEGTLPSGDGHTDIAFSGNFSGEGNQINGTANWEWYDNSFSCRGITVISGQKAEQGTHDFAGEWHGTWMSEGNYLFGNFTAFVTQTDSILSGTIDVPEISMSGAVLQGIVCGNVVYFGDINGIIKFVGKLNNDAASGNYSYMSATDQGTWTAERD